ncbi:MAG: enoyl-CoA hydratase-related protein, partial [Chloroflexota bacterium]|nr:enoyl-CoA hydratase-related protein [Chloroflexota bacterium]
IAWITLNRPDKLNAMNDVMLIELDMALATAEADLEVKVVVLRGNGQCFSVGQDLGGIGTSEIMPPNQHTQICTKKLLESERRRNRRWEYIFNMAKPTIAQVHGYCLGSACYLTMVCDITIASEDAVFGDPLLRMGLLPSMPLWLWLVGIKKTKELLSNGRHMDAHEAEQLGMINKVIPSDRISEEVKRLAKGISLMPSDGLALCKDAINSIMEARGTGEAWRFTDNMQLVMQQRSIAPDEFDFFDIIDKEGMKAAIEARDAPFKGFLQTMGQ